VRNELHVTVSGPAPDFSKGEFQMTPCAAKCSPLVQSLMGSGEKPDRKRTFVHFKRENRIWW